MAEASERWEDNVVGVWYVDKTCILCSLCSELAPNNFRESHDGDHDVVYRQPQTEQELAQSVEAQEQCPVDAIGSDG